MFVTGYAYGGTADFRTDLYQEDCEPVLTHKESIGKLTPAAFTATRDSFSNFRLPFAELIRSLGGRFTPEIKAPEVEMPFGNFTQRAFAAKVVSEYEEYGIMPQHVWLQSDTLEDIEYVVSETEYGAQAVVLDFDDDRFGVRADDVAFLKDVEKTGAKYVAPPMFKLVAPEDGKIVASDLPSSSRNASFTSLLGLSIVLQVL